MKLIVLISLISISGGVWAFSQDTISDLSDLIEKAAHSRSSHLLRNLRYINGEPEDLTHAVVQSFSVLDQDNLIASKPQVVSVADRTRPPGLPGSFKGRELEFLLAPSHWIVIHLVSPVGSNPEIRFDITFPAVKVGAVWRIPGVKYKTKVNPDQ